ncbi:MAG: FKBP-type peptidyl-prolyl cis-trans isomerase [Planctomycetota bacterium]
MIVSFGLALAGLALCLSAQDPAKPGDPATPAPVTTASGLQYTVLQAGPADGERPAVGDRVQVHYTGWLENGTEFDSSRTRGMPAQFVLGRVIPGWNEGLVLMTVGARHKLVVPPELGYGEKGAGGVIPPNATLTFDVELLGIERAPAFVAPDQDKLVATDSGLKVQVAVEGKGEPLAETDRVELHYGVWTVAGESVMSYLDERGPVRVAAGDLRMPFMRELLLKLKDGGSCLAVVPVATAFPQQRPPALGDATDCVWMMKVVQVLRPMPLPEYKAPDPDKLTKTTSGLQYEVITEGSGKQPTAADTVQVHYIGWLQDGTVFDSSYGRGEPAEFPLRGVIPGWTEGVQLMKEGAVYQFVIPPDLAYGANGSPPSVPGNATLTFRIELLHVK